MAAPRIPPDKPFYVIRDRGLIRRNTKRALAAVYHFFIRSGV
jgi:hypothetical protein